jgi:hypothetical protein
MAGVQLIATASRRLTHEVITPRYFLNLVYSCDSTMHLSEITPCVERNAAHPPLTAGAGFRPCLNPLFRLFFLSARHSVLLYVPLVTGEAFVPGCLMPEALFRPALMACYNHVIF